MRGSIQFIGVSSGHPGQMLNKINSKLLKDLQGIEIILVPYDLIIKEINQK